MNKILIPILTVLALSCGQKGSKETSRHFRTEKENVAGGPCSYRHDTLPMVILEISPTGDSIFDIDARRCGPDLTDTTYCDTLSYYMENGGYIHVEDLKRQSLKEGDTICFIEQHMVSGSCNPYITRFTLEKFRRKK